ncbi:trypsin-7-like [Agrilus planipennis]|uniref:Trypsin-7-like n=1 Tax=Agrilus planipennis TaxID=224129 RepID=A0A1W4WJV9_AGRPL|nr:trypsin-7-like [Agrilus planipennis]
MKVLLLITLVSLLLGIGALAGQFDIAEDEVRIVGGNATTIEQFPYIAQLRIDNQFECGACIISPKWVLTAGHCTNGYTELIENITLRVGATEFDQTANEAITLANLYIHPLYNETTQDYDISILLLNNNLVFGNKINSIALPPPNLVLPAGTLATVAGWGTLTYLGALPTQLQEVTVPIITNEECALRYNDTNTYISDRNLCAGYDQGGRDTCSGDSGGPLTANGVLYGVVSGGIGCADAKYPGTYTNVSSVRSFITSVTGL